ncbi:recombinase family protein [Gimesia benthica]|uniref:Recombinase family protein n=1 Tax=Gimesia benthica TaxID=2608982 RepID=A0A6I6AC23_9PLAN|nr:recombinase family protein [Gimesia benthica]QGQ23923.1 recombinase family protein [Gimesia benthica]
MAKRKTAYSYVRFSRPEQLKGDSLRRQKEASQNWCKQNGYYLDESLKLTDKGISAFRGDNAVKGKLGAFVDAIQSGRVKRGSVLIVESLDRISRQAASEAFVQLMSILDKGITIITLQPEEVLTKKDMEETTKILSVILVMTRAYEESSTKSKRIKDAWENKRRKLKDGVKISGRVPGWIEKTGDSFVLNEHAETVKRIVKMYLAGHGPTAIVKALNEDNVPTLGRGKQRAKFWRQSSINKILHSPALIGEFTPHYGKSSQDQSKRVAAGDPISDYYPAIISETDYYKIKKRFDDQRTSLAGRVGSSDGRITNLFKGMIYDRRDKSSMIIVHKGTKSSGRQIVSSRATTDKKVDYIAFPYEVLEEAILRLVNQITATDILPQETTDFHDKLEVAQLKKVKLEEKLKKIENQIVIEDDIEPFLPLINKFHVQIKEAKEEVEGLEIKAHSLLPSSDECRSIVELMKSGENEIDYRRRFRNVFLSIAERVDVLPIKDGHWRQAVITVTFQNGTQRTIVAVCHRAKLIICGAMNERIVPDEKGDVFFESFKEIEDNFKAVKVRSVDQTKKNLVKMFKNYYEGFNALEDPFIYPLKEQPPAKDPDLYIDGVKPSKKITSKKRALKGRKKPIIRAVKSK